VRVGSDLLTRSIATGVDFSLAVKKDGTLTAWGSNAKGQLGDGTTVSRQAPLKIGTDYTNVAAGEKHSIGLKTDGTLWTWGDNTSGQLGDGTLTAKLVPTKIGSGFTGITAGQFHGLAISSDGGLWAWGYTISTNAKGNLGLVQMATAGYK
jgi:alpha-tubulin suppressor-like RCC1 family protein